MPAARQCLCRQCRHSNTGDNLTSLGCQRHVLNAHDLSAECEQQPSCTDRALQCSVSKHTCRWKAVAGGQVQFLELGAALRGHLQNTQHLAQRQPQQSAARQLSSHQRKAFDGERVESQNRKRHIHTEHLTSGTLASMHLRWRQLRRSSVRAAQCCRLSDCRPSTEMVAFDRLPHPPRLISRSGEPAGNWMATLRMLEQLFACSRCRAPCTLGERTHGWLLATQHTGMHTGSQGAQHHRAASASPWGSSRRRRGKSSSS